MRFKRTGNIEDLNRGIRSAEQALAATPEGDPRHAARLKNLAINLEIRFNRTGNLQDLEDAIQNTDKAMQAMPNDHPDLEKRFQAFTEIFRGRFKRSGRMEDFEIAIRLTEEALHATARASDHLNTLSNIWDDRFQQTKELKDLDEAIRKGREAVQTSPKTDPQHLRWQHNLSLLLHKRYQQLGRVEDLEDWILNAQDAVDATQEGDRTQGSIFQNLGAAHSDRFKRFGRIEDLEAAISLGRRALQKGNGESFVLTDCLNNLSIDLALRFGRFEKIEDLKEAIRIAKQALDTTPQDSSKRARLLSNLATMFSTLFETTGNLDDVEEALANAREVVNITPGDDLQLAHRLNSLGGRLLERFGRTGRIEDLDEAVHHIEKAVEHSRKDHPQLAARLTDLASVFRDRYIHFNRMEDLEEAIRVAKQAMELTPVDHPELAERWDRLGGVLIDRFDRTGRLEDVEESIRLREQAVIATPRDHPNRKRFLSSLSMSLLRRYDQLRRLEDLEEAIKAFLKSFNCHNGTPISRLTSASNALLLLQKQKDWHFARNISKEAVRLMTLVSNRTLSQADQQWCLSHFSHLAAESCSFSLRAGDSAAEAVELLELGRGVILGYLIDDRSDISELAASYAEQAEDYDKLRNEVNAPLIDTEDSRSRIARVNRRIEVIRELDNCIESIRRLPGHERFLLGPTPEDLMKQAEAGVIIIVNVTEVSSDAIIISASAITAIELHALTASEVTKWIRQDLTRFASREEYGRNNKKYREFLQWLWTSCVKLVLDQLGFSAKLELHDLPRIWWIGVGLASFLPFHAAGDHSAGSVENTLSRVISSYTPTIKALSYSRGRAATALGTDNDDLKLLLVTMPTTPGERPLPGVTMEKTAVQAAVESSFWFQSLVQPDSETLLRRMRTCDIVHLACHGVSDPTDPSESCLLLQKYPEFQRLPQLDKLTVKQISEVSRTKARIAYLSACSTAESKVLELADEAIHIASGFQAAGFAHVIGSMWSSSDSICVEVARDFYARLRDCGHLNNRVVAAALHESVSRVRQKLLKQPLAWAGYIHLGA
ncbi:hypothetical protein M441DRAFT_145867 [Trichoderma asperellum CBS 433.97]|uniref:CHAT domain-containing protein n=1 Tax=Trichoderma asperellum (strain ATCC 204424 / CBS 433.97 / NBRC 101777) TaxID=1042311 RepID=A0A2T3Z1F7_TRIA4|nr:hypothetical protein M441DRAFT_145867 [Trichoderma asperellum CBS 433.97]PTB38641.1 hypothetical protein M441DRAFT_145867 [Trichoderma asperellum CBS 433.97]